MQDGTFKLTLEFSEEYPNKPPVVKFLSKMFHPNIYADGGICLDILQNRWSPTYDVSAILTSIQSLVIRFLEGLFRNVDKRKRFTEKDGRPIKWIIIVEGYAAQIKKKIH